MHAPRHALPTARPAAARAPLRLGAADHPSEREAHRAAEQVLQAGMRGRPRLHAAAPAAPDPAAPPIVAQVLASPGQALDAGTRHFFEPRFGHDFGRVRVHADAQAARSARAIRAHAYAAGPHIVLGAGAPPAHSAAGRRLLAHELGHVLQQGQGAPALVQRWSYDDDEPCSAAARVQIDDGHRLARAAVTAAREVLRQGPPGEALGLWFRYLFGAQAEAQRSTIADHYATLEAALAQDYTYLCPPATERPCSHAQAEVLSRERVAICAQRVQSFSRLGMARLLVHENVRRAHGLRNVFNINHVTTGECEMSQQGSEYKEATTAADHPIPYSCFAEKALAQQRTRREAQAHAVFDRLFQPGRGPSLWQGGLTIAPDRTELPTRVQLHMRLVDSDFFVFGHYHYRHPVHGPVDGEIVAGIAELQDQPAGLRVAIRFDWREGGAVGRGYWLSVAADRLQGQWGRATSMTDGGDWTLTPQP